MTKKFQWTIDNLIYPTFSKAFFLNFLVITVSLIFSLVLFLMIASCIKLNFNTTQVRHQFLRRNIRIIQIDIIGCISALPNSPTLYAFVLKGLVHCGDGK